MYIEDTSTLLKEYKMQISQYIKTHGRMGREETIGIGMEIYDVPYHVSIFHSAAGFLTLLIIGHIELVRLAGTCDSKWKIILKVPDGFGDNNQSILYETNDIDQALCELVRILEERDL